MELDENPSSLRGALVRIACVLGALLVLYPLGVGPAVCYMVTHEVDHGFGNILLTVYEPLLNLTFQHPELQPLYAMYVAFWLRLTGTDVIP